MATKTMTALDALDGMRGIVEREMVGTGLYASYEVQDRKLLEAGAICGGRRYCAIGSIIVGGGVQPYQDMADDESSRTDVFENLVMDLTLRRSADAFTEGYEHIRVAHEALCVAAREVAEEYDLRVSPGESRSTIEDVFEGNGTAFYENGVSDRGREILLEVIDRAKELVE